VQEALITRLEALREQTDPAIVARQLRVVQDEWHKVRAVPREKGRELWQRYKIIEGELRLRCESFFQQLAVERVENLRKRRRSARRSRRWPIRPTGSAPRRRSSPSRLNGRRLVRSRRATRSVWERFPRRLRPVLHTAQERPDERKNVCNLLCTPGLRFRLGYLGALIVRAALISQACTGRVIPAGRFVPMPGVLCEQLGVCLPRHWSFGTFGAR